MLKHFALALCIGALLLAGMDCRAQTQNQKIQRLLANLASENQSVSRKARSELHKMGKPALPYLVKALTSEKRAWLRLAAASFIRKESDLAKAAIPALITALSDKDEAVRGEAAWAFVNLGEEAKAALPALQKAFRQDKAWTVRSGSALAVMRVGGANSATAKFLADALKTEKDVRVRRTIAESFMTPGSDASVADIAIPALIALVQNEKGFGVRQAAMDSIGWYFDKGRAATSTLADVLKNEKDKATRLFAIDALEKVGGDDAVKALIAGLRDKDSGVRESVASALGMAGRSALPLLQSALETEQDEKIKQVIRKIIIDCLDSPSGKPVTPPRNLPP